MDREFAAKMHSKFKDLLNSGLFSRLGQAKDFDFFPAIQAFEAWSHVPDEKAAIFSLESKNWGRTLVGMMNSTNHGVGGNLDRIEDTMRFMVREVRPELDILWDK